MLSSIDAVSDVDSIYETIEKKQLRVNPTKGMRAEDFMKGKSKGRGNNVNTKRKVRVKK